MQLAAHLTQLVPLVIRGVKARAVEARAATRPRPQPLLAPRHRGPQAVRVSLLLLLFGFDWRCVVREERRKDSHSAECVIISIRRV